MLLQTYLYSFLVSGSDDGSVSSTFSIREQQEPGDKKKSEGSSSSCNDHQRKYNKKSTKKSVKFDLDANEAYDNEVMCKEECEFLWYESADYKYFRRSHKSNAKQIVKENNSSRNLSLVFSYKKVIDRIFRLCCGSVSEFDTFQNLLLSSSIATADCQHLSQWLALDDSIHMGLEKFSVPIIAKERSYTRYEVVDAVLDTQEDYSLFSFDERAEIIRKTSETISRPGRLFAQAIAQAQACALLDYNEKQ